VLVWRQAGSLSDRRILSALAAAAASIPGEAHGAFFITLDKLDKIGWDGVRTELDAFGLPQARTATALDMIAALQDLPAGKLADAIAGTVPGLHARDGQTQPGDRRPLGQATN
jgi:histidyl-tRNA synthetase